MTKLLVPAGSGVAGLSLGMAFGVQTGMEKLHQLTSPLGEELRGLEELRTRLRKRGTSEPLFIGDAAEAEGDRLSSKALFPTPALVDNALYRNFQCKSKTTASS